MSSRATTRLLQVVFAALLVTFLVVASQSFRVPVVSVGDTAPDFSIVADNGRRITRSDFGGKVLVLNFWATWCPPCLTEVPSMDAMQQQLGKDVVVLAVSIDTNEQQYRRFLQRNKVSYLTAWDPEFKISTSYGTFKYPETYIITQDGKVHEKVISNQDWMDPQVLARIRSLL